jgi:dienelactone hydrolase
MLLLLAPAAILTLVTFLLATLWRAGLWLLRRPAPRFWRRTLKAHAALLLFHLFVTVPVAFGLLPARFIGTRGDEARYGGPRIGPDGAWLLQSRESLAAEKQGRATVDSALGEAAAARAVTLRAEDGVVLRGFLVPPEAAPRFGAVVVHGLYRGALEIETPGSMLRDLGGLVLLVELRNHGGSGRARPTYGRDEALDVLAAVEFLRARPVARDRPLVLYAVSLGTAAAALAAPRVPELSALVFDAPMDDLRATALRELKAGSLAQSIVEPWASTILLSARVLGGIPIGAVKPREALARLAPSVSVLFIGAGRDERMPPDSVRALFDALPTPPDRKELWIEEAATHGKVWVAAPDQYRRRLGAFVERAIAGD